MLANIMGITIAGAETDRRGPVFPLIVGVFCFVLGLLVGGCSPSMLVLIAGRALQGFGAGFLFSISFYTIARAYPEAARPRMLALASSAWVIPALIGPALAWLIAEHFGWRWVFFGLILLMPLAAALSLPALRRLIPKVRVANNGGQRSIMAAGGLALGGGFLLSGLNMIPLLPGIALVGAGLLLGISALRVLLPAGTFRVATKLPAAIAITGLLHLAFYGVDAFVPLALTSIRHQPVIVAALALTAGSVCWTAGTWVQTRLVGRLSSRLLIECGLGLLTLGIIGMVVVLVVSVPVSLAVLAWALAGMGMGVAYATNALVVFETAPVGNEGASTAAMQLANVLGIALGTGIGGALVARTGAGTALLTHGIAIQQILMVFIISLALWIARRLPG